MATQSQSLRWTWLLLAFMIGGVGSGGLIGTAFGANQAQAYPYLVWNDEFDGPAIDPYRWDYELGPVRYYRHELQYYTARPENARIENGQLLIEAHQESYNGYNYTSASLITKNRRHFQYGRIEMRAKLPYSQGAFPAFWTVGAKGSPVDWACWPATGEIDIMEMVGSVEEGAVGDNTIYGTAHWNAGDQTWCEADHQKSYGSHQLDSGKFADTYHLFAIEWDATQIKWFMDDQNYYTLDITAANQSELRQPHYLLLNLAVGGDWAGPPNGSSRFPMRYSIDYVRVYSTTPVPSTPPENTLTNPSLESGTTGWNGVGGNWSIVQPGAENARTGTWAFQASTTQQFGSGSGPSQRVNTITPNTDIVARFWLKGTGSIQIVVYNGAWGYIGTTRCDATGAWKLCAYVFNTGSTTSLIIQVQDHAPGTAYIDDLYVGIPPGVMSIDPGVPEPNRLTNPSLESGTTGWNGVGGNWSVVQPGVDNTRSGNAAFQMSTTQQYGSGTGPSQAVTNIPTNTNYVARFWLKGTGAVQIVVYNGAWGYIGTVRCDATSSWAPCSFPFNTSSNTSLIVQMQDHAAGTAYVDDLYLGAQ